MTKSNAKTRTPDATRAPDLRTKYRRLAIPAVVAATLPEKKIRPLSGAEAAARGGAGERD